MIIILLGIIGVAEALFGFRRMASL
jgi:hypothetical protein